MNEHKSVETTPVTPIEDPVGMFTYSGLVDGLRDTAHELLSFEVDADTVKTMAVRYNLLRGRLIDAVGPGTSLWTRSVGEDVSLSGLYAAAAELSRWADLRNQQAAFALTYQLNQAQSEDMARKLAAGQPVTVPGLSEPIGGNASGAAPHSGSTGQYL